MGKLLLRAALLFRRLYIGMQLLIPCISSTKALTTLNRWSYDRRVGKWGRDMVGAGLFPWEGEMAREVGLEEGERILILFAGGGRDAIGFAKLGYEVTAVEFVGALVDMAKKNAETAGVEVDFQLQESSAIDLPEGT
ncbi:MAG: class I SAM-dependent methyltransferase, partial [Planctomycetota bacterium]